MVALAVGVATSGVGVSAGGGFMGLTGTTATMAQAGFSTMASQAAVALVNNKGNLAHTFNELGKSQTVKNVVLSMASAGLADKAKQAVSQTAATNSGITNKLTDSVINVASNTVANTAVNGKLDIKLLEKAMFTALANTAHGELAKEIKGIKDTAEATKWYQDAAHKIAHAIAGCAAAVGSQGRCKDGIVGGAVGEIVAEHILGKGKPVPTDGNARRAFSGKVELITGIVSILIGGNPSTAAQTAKTAVENNYLADWQKVQLEKDLAKCKTDTCKAKTKGYWLSVDLGQDANFLSGMVVGIPESLYETVDGIVSIALSPIDTIKSVKTMLSQDEAFNKIAESVKQSYLRRLDNFATNYEKAGLTGSFDAGREVGKILGEIAQTVLGTGTVAKAGSTIITTGVQKAAKSVGHQINRAVNNTALNKAISQTATVATSTENGFINGSKVCKAACELKPTSNMERKLIDEIIKNGDSKGTNTEKLISSLAERSGYSVIQGEI